MSPYGVCSRPDPVWFWNRNLKNCFNIPWGPVFLEKTGKAAFLPDRFLHSQRTCSLSIKLVERCLPIALLPVAFPPTMSAGITSGPFQHAWAPIQQIRVYSVWVRTWASVFLKALRWIQHTDSPELRILCWFFQGEIRLALSGHVGVKYATGQSCFLWGPGAIRLPLAGVVAPGLPRQKGHRDRCATEVENINGYL